MSAEKTLTMVSTKRSLNTQNRIERNCGCCRFYLLIWWRNNTSLYFNISRMYRQLCSKKILKYQQCKYCNEYLLKTFLNRDCSILSSRSVKPTLVDFIHESFLSNGTESWVQKCFQSVPQQQHVPVTRVSYNFPVDVNIWISTLFIYSVRKAWPYCFLESSL